MSQELQMPDQKPAIRQLTRWLAVVPPVLSVTWIVVCLIWPEIAARARQTGILESINQLITIMGGTPIAFILGEKGKDAFMLNGLARNANVEPMQVEDMENAG